MNKVANSVNENYIKIRMNAPYNIDTSLVAQTESAVLSAGVSNNQALTGTSSTQTLKSLVLIGNETASDSKLIPAWRPTAENTQCLE